MAKVLTGISGNVISAASAAFAPTNSADVSAIASSYQVVSATATQLYAGSAYLTSVNDNPISASRAGNAANASMANSAYYDGAGRLISALPDSATVSAIASSYAESAASSKQDALTFGYNTANQISSIDGSALGGMDEAAVSGIASAYAESAVSAASSNYYTTANESGFLTAQAQASWSESASASPSYIQDKPDLVDIVAGPGIVVDNPDGNTLRVSMAQNYEVELWANSSGSNASAGISLSESPYNFDKISIQFVDNNGNVSIQEIPMESSPIQFTLLVSHINNTATSVYLKNGRYSLSSSTLTRVSESQIVFAGNAVSTVIGTDNLKLFKVVGIHRTASN